MSSLFVYHLRCPACGCTGPTLQLGRMPWEPPEICLPASNRATRALDYIVVETTGEVPLAELARAHSSEDHPVAAASPSGDHWVLTPPLPCPRCDTLIETAIWGGAPSE